MSSDPIKELRELVESRPSVAEYSHSRDSWYFAGEEYHDGDDADHAASLAMFAWADKIEALLPALEQRERFEIPELSRVIAYKLANSGALNADPNAINCVAIPIIERELRAALNL